MALTEERIRACASDEDLFQALSAELHRRLPDGEGDDLDLFVERLRGLPKGLRAMAAIYQLDVSMALDDLGWHFAGAARRHLCPHVVRRPRSAPVLRLSAADEARQAGSRNPGVFLLFALQSRGNEGGAGAGGVQKGPAFSGLLALAGTPASAVASSRKIFKHSVRR
jgi:hypothetical protein